MAERVARPLAPLPWWIALWTSGAFHLIVLALTWLFSWVGGAGSPQAGGEGGIAGAGGDTFEVTVLAGRPVELEHRESASIEAATETVRETEVEPDPEAPRREEARVVLATRERDRARDRVPAPAAGGTPSVESAAPAPPSEPAGEGGDSDATRTGRAAGDPEAAAVILGSVGLGVPGVPGPRAILERALACDDPIEGVWVSHRYRPGARAWARFTLRIEREGEQLRGTITSRMWSGYATDRRPPTTCTADGYDQTYRMVAQGTIEGERFSFGASSYEVLRTDCPGSFITAYAPDRFRGTVDPAREELDTLNNDGHYDIDAPYRFRRTSCLEE